MNNTELKNKLEDEIYSKTHLNSELKEGRHEYKEEIEFQDNLYEVTYTCLYEKGIDSDCDNYEIDIGFIELLGETDSVIYDQNSIFETIAELVKPKNIKTN